MPLISPTQVTQAAFDAGVAKSRLGIATTLARAIQAGAYIALGGVLSLMVGYGFPEATDANPALQRLLSGLMFPIGLVLTVILGAELFTGNNALLMPGAIHRHIKPYTVAINWATVYIGNFIGALLFAYIMAYCAGLIDADPWHTAIVNMAKAKCSLSWCTVFIRGIGANWCVCLAVWLALAARTLSGKVIGCFLPVMAFVVLGYEHCIANMFFIPLGIMAGADIDPVTFVTANLIPATLGNIVGGALLIGTLHTFTHPHTS